MILIYRACSKHQFSECHTAQIVYFSMKATESEPNERKNEKNSEQHISEDPLQKNLRIRLEKLLLV